MNYQYFLALILIPFYDVYQLKTSFQLNGLIYIVTPEEIRNTENFVNIDTIPLIVASEVESLDIDTEFDFKIASMLSKEN